MTTYLTKKDQLTTLLVMALVAVLVSHLGFMPLDTGDEARRALVSLEMIVSGDYITPTLHGEPYFNKPPLYNWLIIGSYKLFGSYSTFALRFPMFLSLLLFGATIYRVTRTYVGPAVGIAAACMLLTNGRVLLYDSLLGLIEITFAWVTYSAMVLVYHFDRKRAYWLLYLSTYALTALGFLLKGLPSVAFQGLTLLGWFVYTRRWRLLFHPAHLVGIGVFVLLTGSYYVAYFSRNTIPVSEVAHVLLTESTKRTGLEFGLRATLVHLFTFPVELIYHFSPYTLLLVLLVRSDIRSVLKENAFIAFNLLTFSTTVLIYWTSPQVYGRYLIGLMPLLFTTLAYGYYRQHTRLNRARYWVERAWWVIALVLAIGCWTAVFHPATRALPGVVWKTAVVSLLLGGLAWRLGQPAPNHLLTMVAVLVVVRLGFNWVVLPGRAAKREFYRDSATKAAQLTRGHALYGYKTTVGTGNATDVSSFHIAATRGALLRRTNRKVPQAYYIADSATLVNESYRVVTRLVLFDRHPAMVVQFKE